MITAIRYFLRLQAVLAVLLVSAIKVDAQTFNFPTTEASTIVTGDELYVHGFPYTLTTWCNQWDYINSTPTWGDDMLFKSNVSLVKFYVDHANTITTYMTPVDYVYHLVFTVYGFNDLSDTTHVSATFDDTLTINFNNSGDNTPYQDINLRKYDHFYKINVVLNGIYAEDAGTLVPAPLDDSSKRNFGIEASILAQVYNKHDYGYGDGTIRPLVFAALPTAYSGANYLDVNWTSSTGETVVPSTYQLEWTYVDDYHVGLDGSVSFTDPSELTYDFRLNSTRVWVNDDHYLIPIIYNSGYIVYRVRAIRPDTVLFKYPVYGNWSLDADNTGIISDLPTTSVFQMEHPFMDDKMNWQYTVSFAEDGKYKNVASFYDGLLKTRQSITRFNTAMNKLIATNNIYDYEGHLSIKTLPAPIKTNAFAYTSNVSLNSMTGQAYGASDFDTGSNHYHVISPLSRDSWASVYYSNYNTDTVANQQKYLPQAYGYPMVQTIYEPGYADRVSAQGGAGPVLQIGDSNYISNYYIDASQPVLNALFGPNVGWSNFYTMTVTKDPNQQYSMVVKDYHGKPMVSSLLGAGPSSATHALDMVYVLSPNYISQDVLNPASSQDIDTITGTRLANVNYFSEVPSGDSLTYGYSMPLFAPCPGQNITVKAHCNISVTNEYGDVLLSTDTTIGRNGVDGTGTATTYAGETQGYSAPTGPYHIQKNLRFFDSDVSAALDSFFAVANCFLTEPTFVKLSVDTTGFPCSADPNEPGSSGHDSDECVNIKWDMMQQLFPQAVYGQYGFYHDTLYGTSNSIYTTVGCPIDSFWKVHCYNPAIIPGGDSVIIEASEHEFGVVDYRCFCTSIFIPDTCAHDTDFATTVTIKVWDLYDSTRSIYVPFLSSSGNMTGHVTIESNWNLGVADGSLYESGVIVGSIAQHSGAGHDTTIITLPLQINGNNFTKDIVCNVASPSGDAFTMSFTGTMSGRVDSMHRVFLSPIVDSLGPDTTSSLCHKRYQDTCLVPGLTDTITINGNFYAGLHTMRTDSFNMIYMEAIAAGNYTLAEQMLPLHPQYCAWKNCFIDTFKAQVFAIPDWQTAESMGLFLLDSLVAKDPVRDMLDISGLGGSAADSLSTFPGGLVKLDSIIYLSSYCGCHDSIMFQECAMHMFANEIANHLLINATVKKTYFKYMVAAYFSNRQRFVDSLLLTGGSSCPNCANVRMTLEPSAVVLPASIHVDSDMVITPYSSGADWMINMIPDSLASLYDSTLALYHTEDSSSNAIAIDSVIAHISNCIMGDAGLEANLRTSLQTLCDEGEVHGGSFSHDQILTVLNNNGVSITDLCNPYVFNFAGTFTDPSDNDCLPLEFYDGLNAFLSLHEVSSMLQATGSYVYGYILDTTHNYAETNIARALGNIQKVDMVASYDGDKRLYTLYISPSGSTDDTVEILLHSGMCNDLFSMYPNYTASTTCANAKPVMGAGIGLVNQYGFILSITPEGAPAPACTMLGWIDRMPTMHHDDGPGPRCIPCTTMMALYKEFTDSASEYGLHNIDNPMFTTMLANFMNEKLAQQYSADDYMTFIESCALADSMLFTLNKGSGIFQFSSAADMNSFISAMNAVDPEYTFDNSYRDSSFTDGRITICIDLNGVPQQELWMYRNAMSAYSMPAGSSRIIEHPLALFRPAGEIGFLYTDLDIPFDPRDSSIIDTTNIHFVGPYYKKIWTGNQFVTRNFYNIVQTGASPYEISRAVYQLTAYIFNNDISGATFVPEFMSTIDPQYFTHYKQEYLQYVYGFEGLPDYEVLDKVQTDNLVVSLPSFSHYNATYSARTTPSIFSNIYLWNTGMSNAYYDTLQHIFELVSPDGEIFHNATSMSVSVPAGELNVYRCSDNSYWYRYFTTGDTMFNAYVAFPSYVPMFMRSSFHMVGDVIPLPGDSLNRHFSINAVRYGTTDTITLQGISSFVIGKSIELDNMLMRMSPLADNGGADTFDNCERQKLYAAIQRGVVTYNNYIDSVRQSIEGKFRSHIVKDVGETLTLKYQVAEQQFTLYNYDRAGNLIATMPPAGVVPLPFSGSEVTEVDESRQNNTPGTCPTPTYNKYNIYTYNSMNAVNTQTTINGGKTRFMYDAAGRLIFSQNAKQALTGTYSYNVYDNQSRIVETGEAAFGCPYFDSYESPTTTGIPSCSNAYPLDGGSYLISPDPDIVLHTDRIADTDIVHFIRSFDRDDIVATIYDTAAMAFDTITGFDAQQNLRKRVACTKFIDSLAAGDVPDTVYRYATHYSYDPQGNVQTLVQDYPTLSMFHKRYIRIDYDYDVISGKVNMLSYDRGHTDQFYQRYAYDADNRITAVTTSSDGYIWKNEVEYSYYDHGPLARTVLGDLRVQGIDYAYTLQGWIKAVNGDSLYTQTDIGNDGVDVTAPDAVAYTIDYFKGDYNSITGRKVQQITVPSRNLYNGNIARQTVAIENFTRLHKQYVYDQLNRIISANYATIDAATGDINSIPDYKNQYTYDPDGNIQTLLRYGNDAGSGAQVMDDLSYVYPSIHDDKLTDVTDAAADNYTNDLRQYTTPTPDGRYKYDPIGNLSSDMVNGIDSIYWNLYGKVKLTENHAANTNLQFDYDAAGNRVAKNEVRHGNISNGEYYVRDATGNILATYNVYSEKDPSTGDYIKAKMSLGEHDIYGSSRIGVKRYMGLEIGSDMDFGGGAFDTIRLTDHLPWYSLEYQDVIKRDSTNLYGNAFDQPYYARHVRGTHQYELTDHLGDVLATVSDKRQAGTYDGSPGTGDWTHIKTWSPILVSAQDYYPFGEYMPGRYVNDPSMSCITTNVTEMLPELYDWVVPALTPVGASGVIGGAVPTPSSWAGTMTIYAPSPGDGAYEELPISETADHVTLDVVVFSGTLYADVSDPATGLSIGGSILSGPGSSGPLTVYLTTPHSNLVKLTITATTAPSDITYSTLHIPRDTVVAHNIATSVCNTDFYEYGFNRQMKDNEWAGLGNHYDFKFREYDSRIGRFISVDPLAKKYPWNGAYNFAENRVVDGIDLEGKEFIEFMLGFSDVVDPGISKIGIASDEIAPLEPAGQAVETPTQTGGTQSHHVVPRQYKADPVVEAAREQGFDFEGDENRIDVEKYSKSTGEGRHGNHPNYNKEVGRRIEEFKNNNPDYSPEDALNFIKGTQKSLRGKIESNPDKKINDLFKSSPAVDNTAHAPQTLPQQKATPKPKSSLRLPISEL